MYVFFLVGSVVFVDVSGKPAVDVGGNCNLDFDMDRRLDAVLRSSVGCSGECMECTGQRMGDCMPYAVCPDVR